jgi:heptosyltransferase-2
LNILIIRLSSLGDIVLAEPLVRALKENIADSNVEFLTRRAYLPIVKSMKGVDRAIDLDDRIEFKKLRRLQFDYIVDLQNNFRSGWLIGGLRRTRIVRYHRPRLNRWLRIHVPSARAKLATPAPVSRQYIQAATRLDLKWSDAIPKLSASVEGQDLARKRLDQIRLDLKWEAASPVIAVSPGGRHGTKVWPIDKWEQFLKLANDSGMCQVLFLGSGDEVSIGEDLSRRLGFPVANLCGKTGLEELIALTALVDGVVCGDSGPMHLAAAVGTPVVGIFGPTVKEFGFAPQGEFSRVVEVSGLECRPCHPHGPEKCPLNHYRCMCDIEPSEVLKNLQTVMGNKRTRRE